MRAADVAAGIVVFRPEPRIVIALAEALLAECAQVFVFINAFADEEVRRALREAGAELLECDVNLGIAEALNVLTLAAALRGARRIVLMDQDSVWPSGGVAQLGASLDSIIAAGGKPAVVGPLIVAPEGYKPPRYFRRPRWASVGLADPVRYIITSGTMLEIDAFRRIGRFRSDFFIDAVDTEWCFRAWARGYSCWAARDVKMLHTIGQGIERSRAFGARIPRHPRMRLLSYLRNQAHCITLPHVPWRWKTLLALHLGRLFLVVSLKREPGLVRAALRAIGDGLAGKLGPPSGAEAAPRLDGVSPN
ncbi:MAG: glycosyltransferase family 2 protein [Hyphomonadaceae bacterium]